MIDDRARTGALPAATDPIDTAMVLAAGLGSRMRPLTDVTPKPLLPVAGRALLDHTLDRLVEAGVARAVVNTHHLADQIDAHLVARAASGSAPALLVSDERDALLETGGGVARALPLLARPAFFVTNSDNIWMGPRALAPLAAAWRAETMDALLLLVPIEAALEHSRPGDFFLEATPDPSREKPRATRQGPAARRLLRRGTAARAPYVYTGAQILAAATLDGAPAGAFSLNWAWDRAIAAGRAFGVVHSGGWIDVGAPAGLEAAERAVSQA